MRLWLVRHARVLAAQGLCYGSLDVAADPAHTAETAQALAQVLPAGAQVLSSPLTRCTQLALALARLRPELPCQTETRLAEMDFGAWEGRAWDSIAPDELAAWTADFPGYRAGGRGECVAGFAQRVGAVLQEASAGARDQAWLAHAGVFKAVLLRRQGRAPQAASDWPLQGLDFGRWQVFEL